MTKKKITTLLCFVLLCTFNGDAQIITTIAGCGGCSILGDGGPATDASIGFFAGVATDKQSNLYIADGNNHRVRKVDFLSGTITTVAGNGTPGFSGDNFPATAAQLNSPTWVCIDTNDNLYITDGYNDRIRKVSTSGIITTFAGNGIANYTGDGFSATNASINAPQGICADRFGNLFINDNANHRIRKVNNIGIITTVAGNGISAYSGDGGHATNASIIGISAICADDLGNIYVADQIDARIRKVNSATGLITTVAGTGTPGYNGDGLPATISQINWPMGLACDKAGNIYIGDYSNQRIRKISIDGTLNTVAGNGVVGFSGDGGIALSAKLNRPQGISFDTCGNMYVADKENRRVRKVSFNPSCSPISVPDVQHTITIGNIYPNPANSELTITAPEEIKSVSVVDMMGRETSPGLSKEVSLPVRQTGSNERSVRIDVSQLPAGVYVVRVNGVYFRKFVKE